MKVDKNEAKLGAMLLPSYYGRDDSRSDQYRYPYEPTPYSVLERLANTGYIRKGNTLLDYGCGKGRVDFFLSYQTGVILLVLNMMTGSMQRRWKIKRRLCLAGEYPLRW